MIDGNLYEVEKILDRRTVKGKKEYLIKWKGYSERECTWEPTSHLKYIKHEVKNFEEQYNKNKNRKGCIKNNEEKNKIKTENEEKEINKDEIKDKEKIKEEIKKEKEEDKKSIEKKKENKLIGKKRKNSEKELKEVILSKNESIFQIDHSLEKILAIKLENKSLIAVVERRLKNGKINKEIMTTEDLKKTNPWILIEYYEDKIRFA